MVNNMVNDIRENIVPLSSFVSVFSAKENGMCTGNIRTEMTQGELIFKIVRRW